MERQSSQQWEVPNGKLTWSIGIVGRISAIKCWTSGNELNDLGRILLYALSYQFELQNDKKVIYYPWAKTKSIAKGDILISTSFIASAEQFKLLSTKMISRGRRSENCFNSDVHYWH